MSQGKGGDWDQFVEFVMKERKFLASHLQQVNPLELPPGTLRLGVEDRHHLSYLQDQENLSVLKDLAKRFYSSDVQVVIAASASKSRQKASSSEAAKPKSEEENNVVSEALRIFGGSIKEVKQRP
ncbi:MAG: hypothetical protein GTO40_11825 [Deltaproteobacteria bacterium]|nr:hypothetical protein [Deltaproteobacteria bacterium]